MLLDVPLEERKTLTSNWGVGIAEDLRGSAPMGASTHVGAEDR